MRRFLEDNEKVIEWGWRLVALLLLLAGAWASVTYAKRDDVVALAYRIDTLEMSQGAQVELAKQVATLSTQVAVLAHSVASNGEQQAKTNDRLDRIIEHRAAVAH